MFKFRNHCLFAISTNYKLMATRSKTLETLNFDNKVYKCLPIDTEERNYVRTVSNACFSKVKPTPLKNPKMVCYSLDALKLVDINENEVKRDDFVEYFVGNKLLPGSEPLAHCYCGHQFGVFAGQLGDGAAIYLGEIINEDNQRWELQLKGAGLTPYSRSADGRKVLRSSIREYLCSEAMHYLGIPTTRAGTCITSDETVERDIFYDGHPKNEKCTVISRIAQTFIRFGSFEIFKVMDPMTGRRGPSVGRYDIFKTLLDYVVETFYPHIVSSNPENDIVKYKLFYEEVVRRTAKLVALWQCVGFCHGVLNTDNMSIIGLTIDYGPFGFLDRYDPDHICNSSDDGGRYTYKKQPEICKWNLMKLAEVLDHFLPKNESFKVLEDVYYDEFYKHYYEKMRKKLGLLKKVETSNEDILSDKELVEQFFNAMEKTGADFTNSFRCLSLLTLPGLSDHKATLNLVSKRLKEQCSSLEELIAATDVYAMSRETQLIFLLLQTNPQLLAQMGKGPEALDVMMQKLETRELLKKMDQKSKEAENESIWSEWLQKYVKRLEYDVSEISGDTDSLQSHQKERVKEMNSNNPRFVLRNYIAHRAIEKAEKGDFSEVWRVFKLLQNPYADSIDAEAIEKEIADKTSGSKTKNISNYDYDSKPPVSACKLRVSCSS
ncbi:selenoprotein O-like isoform X2 [Dinothrombium tinctorium]|uniref:Selenoprotein O n=1 Tax=Dinothrombium tinctorium TaxID=1965070 RepID=A0A443RR32_9ACAR|nr:selenoprotein O-like isoform X2 [Dinothrombium tinctorium]